MRYNAAPHMNPAAGSRLGPYEILSALGAGGMGEVYRARDTKLNRDVAIKVLPDALRERSRPPRALHARSADARLAQPSEHRRRSTGSSRNPADAGHGATRRALVMELVEGEDLSQRHRARADAARRGAADRAADRRRARSRARAGHHPSRSEAGEHQGARRRHGEGARLRPGQGDGPGGGRRAPDAAELADDHAPARRRWA